MRSREGEEGEDEGKNAEEAEAEEQEANSKIEWVITSKCHQLDETFPGRVEGRQDKTLSCR